MSRAKEIEQCRKAVKVIGSARPLKAIYGPLEFNDFVRELQENEIAVLSRLITLDERPIPQGQEGTPAFERVRKHWMDPTLMATRAIETALNVAGDLNGASRSTWERIFGNRTMRQMRTS